MVIPRDRFFYPTLTIVMDPFLFTKKKLSEVPEYAEMPHDMMTSL